jgi:ribose transport system substrate-binding protein
MLIERMRSSARSHMWLALLATALLAMLVAGCGDDDDEGGNGGGGAAAAATVDEAQQRLDDAKQPLTFEPPGPQIDASKASGRTLALVIVDERVPTLASAADSAEEAAEVAGIQTTRFDAQSQVNRMQQGISQAIREADAIALLGIPIAAVQPSLQEAKQADIPMISVLNNQPEANEPGQGAGTLIYASSAPDYREGGALAASKAIVDTEGEANVEIFNTEEITPSVDVVEGMRSVLDQCDTCSVSQNSTPLAEWSTALTGKAQSVIRSNPDLNYILPIFDNMAIFITAGIQQAGAGGDVRNASINGTPAALELIQREDVLTADVGQPNRWLGWHVVDQAVRGIIGAEPSDPAIPIRFLDKENLEGVDVDDLDAPYGDNLGYEDGFRQLWGVG